MGPNDFEYRSEYHNAVEAIERRLEIIPWTQSVDFNKHLRHKQAEEYIFRVDCEQNRYTL